MTDNDSIVYYLAVVKLTEGNELDAITHLFLLLILIGGFFTLLGVVAGALQLIAMTQRQIRARRYMATTTKPRD